MSVIELLRERGKLRVLLAMAVVLFVSLGLFYLAPHLNKAWEQIAHEFAAALLVIGTLHFLWEVSSKRSFMEEVFVQVNSARELMSAGIAGIALTFESIRDWEKILEGSNSFDIIIMYGYTWRRQNYGAIRSFVDRGGKLRVALPDPQDNAVISVLAGRLDKSPDWTKAQIEDAIEFFEGLGESVSIFMVRQAPLFSLYMSSSTAVFAPYSNRNGRVNLPAFLCVKEGFIYQYLREEFEAVISRGQPRLRKL